MKVIKYIIFTVCCLAVSFNYSKAQIGIHTENVPSDMLFMIDGAGDDPQLGTLSAAQLYNNVAIDKGGKLGLGMLPVSTNSARLQIRGSIHLFDSFSTVAGSTLTTDDNAVGRWKDNGAITMKYGVPSPTGGLTGVYPNGIQGKYYSTGAYIELPPGKWNVFIQEMLVCPSLRGQNTWAVLIFSEDENENVGSTGDAIGSSMISGNKSAGSHGGVIRGSVVLRNAETTGTKRYYLKTSPGSRSGSDVEKMQSLGSFLWAESAFYAYKLSD